MSQRLFETFLSRSEFFFSMSTISSEVFFISVMSPEASPPALLAFEISSDILFLSSLSFWFVVMSSLRCLSSERRLFKGKICDVPIFEIYLYFFGRLPENLCVDHLLNQFYLTSESLNRHGKQIRQAWILKFQAPTFLWFLHR